MKDAGSGAAGKCPDGVSELQLIKKVAVHVVNDPCKDERNRADEQDLVEIGHNSVEKPEARREHFLHRLQNIAEDFPDEIREGDHGDDVQYLLPERQ